MRKCENTHLDSRAAELTSQKLNPHVSLFESVRVPQRLRWMFYLFVMNSFSASIIKVCFQFSYSKYKEITKRFIYLRINITGRRS